jgi:Replication initiator protein, pSAM2
VFATFTAPSFGQVHTRRARGGTVYSCHPARLGERCPHGRRQACWHKHDEGDARLGEPICPGCYDTKAQALWNALAPELWRRTTIALRRVLAGELGLTSEEFARRVRVAYVKVAEYQARGAVHFHAVFRLDGRDPTNPGAVLPPPEGSSVELLERAIREAAERARVLVPSFANVPHGRCGGARSSTYG